MYFTSLHGEREISDSLIELLELSNLPAEALKSRDEIPSDAGVIVINNPSNDITENEGYLLQDYLNKGGKLFVITDHTRVENLKNLLLVLEKYGLSAQSNEIFETKTKLLDDAYLLYLKSLCSYTYLN